MNYIRFALSAKITTLLVVVILSLPVLSAQSKSQREAITASYNTKDLTTLILTFENDFKVSLNKMVQASKSTDFEFISKTMDDVQTELIDFGTDGTSLFYSTYNVVGKVSRANSLYKDGLASLALDGANMQVGVWDSGIALPTHQEFDGRAINSDSNNGELDAHATMVTGAIISSGIKESAKGVANKSIALSYDWKRDKIEVAREAANGLLLSNHSYGINSGNVPDWYFGSYIKVSQDWDKIMYNAPYYLMVTAAGNNQQLKDNDAPSFGDTQDGFDLLLGFNTSKNGLVIAAAETKIDEGGKLKDASVSSYSSLGPIDDSRIKPDLAGDGTAVYSTYSYSDQSYNSLTGTSMAAPGVTGALLLLQEYYGEQNGSYMKAASLKGLALHTAVDVQEEGPDYKMGWGVLNTEAAAEVLTNRDFSTIVSEESLMQGQSYSITVITDGRNPLKASISWTDPEGQFVNMGDLNNTTAALVNDLDIRITRNGDTYFPWKLMATDADASAIKGDNQVDPFERIDIYDAQGEYTITVTHKGTLSNGIQDFSLLVSGIKLSACELIVPKAIALDKADENSVSWIWGAMEETLYEVQFKEANSPNWNTELTWDNTIKFSDLELGKTYQVRLRSVCSENLNSEFSEIMEFVFNGTTTKIKEKLPIIFEEESAFTVYPNPAVSIINIAAEMSPESNYSILTSFGKIIKRGKTSGEINVSSLKSGVYIISLQDEFNIKSTKFFKR